MNKENKLTLYKDGEGKVSVSMRFADEEMWLRNQRCMNADVRCDNNTTNKYVIERKNKI